MGYEDNKWKGSRSLLIAKTRQTSEGLSEKLKGKPFGLVSSGGTVGHATVNSHEILFLELPDKSQHVEFYPSDWTSTNSKKLLRPNQFFTMHDTQGMEWTFKRKNTDDDLVYISSPGDAQHFVIPIPYMLTVWGQ